MATETVLEAIRSEIALKEAEVAALKQALSILEKEPCKPEPSMVQAQPEQPRRRRPHPVRDYGRPAPEQLLNLMLEKFRLKEGVPAREVRKLAEKRLGMPSGTVSSALFQLTQKGILYRDENGLYKSCE